MTQRKTPNCCVFNFFSFLETNKERPLQHSKIIFFLLKHHDRGRFCQINKLRGSTKTEEHLIFGFEDIYFWHQIPPDHGITHNKTFRFYFPSWNQTCINMIMSGKKEMLQIAFELVNICFAICYSITIVFRSK